MKLNNYRIWRVDPNNIAIQRLSENKRYWIVVSYHGNSPNSLITGLYTLAMSQYTPSDTEIREQLEELELELVSGMGEIKKMIKEYYGD